MTSHIPRRACGALVVGALLISGSAQGVRRISQQAEAAPTVTGSITGAGVGAATRSGVFRDIDSDGVWDTGEPGQGGITVTATCVADDGLVSSSSFDDTYGPITTTTTAASGAFTLSGPNVRGVCRVEFAIPTAMQTFLQPGVATQAGGTFVQFVDASTNPTVTASVHNPGDYTGPTSTPDVVTGVSLAGSSSIVRNPVAGTTDTLLRLDDALDTTAALAQGDDTGSIWGIAWDPATETVFAASALKRHAGIGPAGPDAIYAVGPNRPAAWATPFTAVDTDGGQIGTDTARGIGRADQPSLDIATFAQAGTLGWGDLDISEDGRTLYAVNLSTKSIQSIDVATRTAGAAVAIPTPACTNGTSRPWGLEVHDGLIYAGVVCDAGTGTVNDLAAFVFAYNPTSATLPVAGIAAGVAPGAWTANLVQDSAAAPGIQLNYAKGCAFIDSQRRQCTWNPWEYTYIREEFNSPSWAAVRPQPILSDIEIDDDGSLLLAFIDRTGLQFGFRNYQPTTLQGPNVALLEGIATGDVLRAGPPAASGTFTLENNGTVARGAALPGTITGAPGNGDGPGGGEVYAQEFFVPYHEETGQGALAKAPGRSDYLMSIMDPIDTDSGGIGRFPISGAARTDAVELYDSTVADGTGYGFGKGSGLADIEVLTRFAPVEVGNRVWRDDNANGIQDAGEPPIAGVQVQLLVGGATYTATTDAFGHYLFSSVARTGATTAPLLAGANYRFGAVDDAATIRILNASGATQQAALAGTRPTEPNDLTPNAPNVAGSNASDSDGTVDGTTAQVSFTLGGAGGNDVNATASDVVQREGYNRHVYDFGFVPAVSVGNRVWFDTDNDSTLDAGEQPVSGVAVQLFSDANANGVIDVAEQTPVAYDVTDANGLYYFNEFTNPDGSPLANPRLLAPGNYVVGVAPSNFAGTGALVGYHSSGTSLTAAGTRTETAPPDPDVAASNVDDNGALQANGFFLGGVLAPPVTLTAGGEPTAEETGVLNNAPGIPDANSNLTVDFGFYTTSVGNRVFVDDGRGGGNDDDGIQNGGEPGLGNVPVRLYSSDGVEIPVGPDGRLGTPDDGPGGMTTAADGTYSFSGLPEGTYVVRIDAPADYRSSTDPATAGTPLAADLDDNGIGATGGTIASAPFTLDAGSTADGHSVTNATGTTNNPRVDYGLVQGYDLTIAKSVTSAGPYVAGATVTYSIVASNRGPGVALDGFTVTDRLPAGVEYTVPAATGTGWTCAAPNGLDVTCTWEGPTPGLGNDVLAGGAAAEPITVNAIVVTPSRDRMVNNVVVEPSPNQSVPETIPVGTTPDRFEDGNPTTGSNNDDSASITSGPVQSLGDVVWHDTDRDGQLDPTELGVPGVTVTLLGADGQRARDAFGAAVPDALTDVNGRYQFDDLATGDYSVRFTLPAGYVWTTADTGDDGLDSDAVSAAPDAATATTDPFALTGTPVPDVDPSPLRRAVTDPTIDAGIVQLVSLGDLVWIDANGNGQFDPAEQPLAGVDVELLGDAGAATTTDGNGRYEFTRLLPGDYRVRFTLPAGYAWTASNTGGDGLDSDAVFASPTATTATTGVVTLTATPVVDSDNNPARRAVTDPTIDAGVVPIVSLGDLVWIDADLDGQFDGGAAEPGIAGVTVRLLDPAGAPATDASGAVVAPADTDANGRYEFTNLLPGDYVVEFERPAGYAWTVANTGPDGLDNDATWTTQLDATADTDVFTLSATPVTDTDTDANRRTVTNPTIDAGVVPLVSLGDVVWLDADRDGVYDADESPAPVGSVEVRLLDEQGNPARDASGALVAPVTTDANGRYSFTNLLPARYVVEFVLPAGYAWTLADRGADDGLDSDAIAASPSSATARSPLVDLTSATNVADTDPRASRRPVTNPTIDAGIVPSLSLGDVVWNDTDRDGVYDAAESPVQGVRVELVTAAGGPVTDVNGAVVGPETTDPDGRYSFDALPPGSYRVVFTLPAGSRWTVADAPAGGTGLDSDALFDAPTDATATTAPIQLTSAPVDDTDPRASRRSVTNPTIDAGIVTLVSLGDVVFVDEDGDGVYDPATESPLPGVTVGLLDAAGNPARDADGQLVPDVTTDTAGRYSFDTLFPGGYRVEFTLPTGYLWTTPNANANADDQLDSDAVAATPASATATTAVVTVTEPVTDADPDGLDVTDPTIDAGVVPLVSLGDVVWVDSDRDGVFDTATEDGIAGVIVRLLTAAGAPAVDALGLTVAPVTTDADGRYQFSGLRPGDYQVRFSLPTGYVWTSSNQGADDGLDNDSIPDGAAGITAPTATTAVFTLTSNRVTDTDPLVALRRDVTNPTIDAGVVPRLSLGDLVWVDTDRDGVYDPATESGIDGVAVRLIDGAGNTVVDLFGVPQTTTTDANGRYTFDDLAPGTYRVEFTLPGGHVWTTPNAAGANDALDSDALPAGGAPAAATATTAPITLTATPVTDADPAGRPVTNPTIDAGVVPVLSLGDLVWNDLDRDGVYEPATEDGIAGVRVRLLDENGDPADDVLGNPIAPTTTDADGRYDFVNLAPGRYVVEFTLPDGFAWTLPDVGSPSLDSDAVPATPSAPTARTAPFSLSTATVLDEDPAGRDLTNPTIDAGVVQLLSLGDLVWVDADRDGLYDPATEDGIAGVTVTLLDGAGNPALGPNGQPVPADVTDADGRYSFTGLLPGTYRVRFALPADHIWTTANVANGDDGLDSDPLPAGGAPDAPTATTAPVLLTSTVVTDPDPAGLDLTDPTIDAGIVPLLSLGDVVWVDTDRDGVLDPTESGAPGVPVRLVDANGVTLTDAFGVPQTTTTDANGRYSFDDLLPGTYRVEFGLPARSVWTQPNQQVGGDDLDSDALFNAPNDAFATTGPIVLTPTVVADSDPDRVPGLTNGTIDAGIVPLLSLGDLVWVDVDRDGLYDQGEQPIAGVAVRLVDAPGGATVQDALGNDAATTTDADGRYAFRNLLPGTYRVEFALPLGYVWTTANVVPNANDGLDSDPLPAGGAPNAPTATTAPVTLTPTVVTDPDPDGLDLTNPTIDAGVVPLLSLGDLVWVDADRDGVYDTATEDPLPGVVVTLLQNGIRAVDGLGNPVADVTTGPDGRYSFTNLLPGDYQVQFTQPGGYVWTQPGQGPAESLDSDALPVERGDLAATTAVFTLGPVSPTDDDPNGLPVTNPTIDAGLVPLLSVGDLVWVDSNRDGVFDIGTEQGIAGVRVELLTPAGGTVTDGLGNTVAPATTGLDGRYEFDDLLAGTYAVRFSLPDGYAWTIANVANNANNGLDSDPIPAARTSPTATTATFLLDASPVVDSDTSAAARDVTDPTIDAGVVALVSLGDVVFVDRNLDGVYDPATEDPLPGVTVALLDAAGAPARDAAGQLVPAATTDADGRYSFDGLFPGDYRVQFTLPEGYLWTTPNANANADDQLDSDAVPATPASTTATTAVVTVTDPVTDADPDGLDVTDPTIDAGVVPLVSLGDVVWVDTDRDGVFDTATEDGIEGVTVRLLDAAGAPAVNAAGAPIAPTTTDANGRYSFEDLPPGDYRVQFSLPPGFSWSPSGAGADRSLDSDAVAASPLADTATSGVIPLRPTPVADNDPDGLPLTNPTIDAGVMPVLSLGDLVWVDEDADGVYDPLTENPLPGVTASLTDTNGDAVFDANGDPIADVQTDADGRYFFTNLDPGTYVVTFTLPDGYVWTPAEAGTDRSLDSDATPDTPAPDAPTASSGPITLGPGGPVVPTDNDPEGLGVTNPTIDAGVVPLLSIGDVVWVDTDNDGVYDANEAVLPGVTVTLRDGNGNAVTDAFGNTVAPTTTGPNGRYQFDDLLPGRYQVVFTLPDGYAWSPANAGGDDGRDSDVTSSRTAPSGTTAVITLSSTPVTDTDPNGLDLTNPTIDAGVVPLLSAGDLVWADLDGDGVFDQGEPPLAGVPVRLLDAAGNPARDAFGNLVPPVETGPDGRYRFDNLPPGDYQVEFTLIGGFAWTTPNAGSDDSLDSDAIAGTPTASTARTPIFSLTPAPVTDNDPNGLSVTNPTLDAGLRPVLSVGDLVWYDIDADGVLDPGEPPAPGVTVTLLTADGQPARDATGAVVPSTTTDANGRYSFNNLVSGTYVIVFDLPAGAIWSPANAGGNDALDSDVIASSPRSATAATAPFTLTTTPVTDADPSPTRLLVTNPTIDAGIIPLVAVGDVVWRDLDHDGLQDAGEPGVPGITVTLLDGNGNPARDAFGNVVPTATTGANGGYVFTDLLPGSYSIQFGNLPPGFEFTFQGQGGPIDSNASATGRTPLFTLLPGDPDLRPVAPGDPVGSAMFYNPTVDAGIYAPLVDGLPPTDTTVPATTQPIVRLPSTGSDVGDMLALAAIAMLLGGALVLTTRRRRPNIR